MVLNSDIVVLLQDDALHNSCPSQRLLSHYAAEEIERLRVAGDAMAEQITKPCRCVEAHDGAINETCAPCVAYFDWQEARRG